VKEVSVPYIIRNIDNKEFEGQVAVVTGGSGVIGRSISIFLASKGCKVYVVGTNNNNIKKVVDEIKGLGLSAESLNVNLLSSESIEDAFQKVVSESGSLDILVNSAGGGARDNATSLDQQKIEVIDKVLNLNLRGIILTVREAVKIMKPKNRGNIVVLSSTVGVRGLKYYSEYAAAKGGIISFVASMAMELGEHGIRINCVTPGIVQRGELSEDREEALKATNWLQSYGIPEDIASMVCYLNTAEARFITGQNFIIDGGRSLGLKNSK
ncbi:MAG: SDR family oxidoreductase, partial [Muribaculaceae bacterium]|nr:SDR family oxidoreductase [Muribaculaceae bacterium]